MSKWSRFYEKRMTPLYRSNLKRKYKPFVDLIANRNPQYLLEAGCGAGHITRILANELPTAKFVCVDLDRRMLSLAENNVCESTDSERVSFERRDITARSLREYQQARMVRTATLIHSHGVLEHFNENEINRIIASQLACSDTLIHCVPSAKYRTLSYGDERLLSASDWKRICNPTRVVEFNQGYDLALIWE